MCRSHTDAWCRNQGNNIPPVYNLPAHIAPLDIVFYNGDRIPGKKGKMAIIPSHGSWNRYGIDTPKVKSNFTFRSPSKGRMIGFLNLDDNNNPTNYEQIFWGNDPSSFFIRPVAVVVGPCKAYNECIFFSDDNRGVVYALAYVGPDGQVPQAPVSAPVVPPVKPVEIGQPVTLYVFARVRILISCLLINANCRVVGPSTLTYTLK